MQSYRLKESGAPTSISPSSSSRPRLALPLGDPAGIGPEVALKAMGKRSLPQAADIVLIGTSQLLEQTMDKLAPLNLNLPALESISLVEAEGLGFEAAEFSPGQPTSLTGQASFAWLNTAIAGALAGKYDGIVTAPIAKSVWHQAGYRYPGQTEVLAERSNTERFGMAFVARSPHTHWQLRALLATTHIPLQQVPETLCPTLMTRKLALLVACLEQDFGIASPHIAVSGLNPHSGEAGNLGSEEQDWLIPWIEDARSRYPQVRLTGPVPPDTLWVSAGQAWYEDAQACPYDAYLALYHDQGLIPVKLLAFDRAVNTTIGLPFVRTSPDHGTAFDIAGKGQAQADSMIAAIELAIALVNQRKKLSL